MSGLFLTRGLQAWAPRGDQELTFGLVTERLLDDRLRQKAGPAK